MCVLGIHVLGSLAGISRVQVTDSDRWGIKEPYTVNRVKKGEKNKT